MTLAPSPNRTSAGADRSRADWLSRLSDIGRNHGFFERVGSEALALFVQEGDTLVVSFDRATRVCSEERDGLPPGFEAVQKREWSLLSILSTGDSWFRSQDVMAFFDTLAESGFFDSFAQVIFLGFGPANGHAACAYASARAGRFEFWSRPRWPHSTPSARALTDASAATASAISAVMAMRRPLSRPRAMW